MALIPRALPAAVRGAVAFLTRLPVGGREASWEAFRRTPAAFPLVGYLVGALAASAVLLPAPPSVRAAAYVVALYLLTGVTHADGLADLGDAAAVHAPPGEGRTDATCRRYGALKDAETGVGGTLAIAVVVAALALGALGLPGGDGGGAWTVAARLVVAAEVGAKTGMALLICLGSAPHEGLGSQLTGAADAGRAVPALAAALPVALVPGAAAAASLSAVGAASLAALAVGVWATRAIGGVSGDVLGAANEVGRVAALNAGVIAWTLS